MRSWSNSCGLDTPRQLGRSERGTDHVQEDAGVNGPGEAPRLDFADDVGDARHSGRPLWQGTLAKSMSFRPYCTSVPRGQSPFGPARVMDDTAVGVAHPSPAQVRAPTGLGGRCGARDCGVPPRSWP